MRKLVVDIFLGFILFIRGIGLGRRPSHRVIGRKGLFSFFSRIRGIIHLGLVSE